MEKNKLNVKNFLIWRRGIIEHVRKGKLKGFGEYAVFGWLCTLANPFTGTIKTSFHELAEDFGTTTEEIRYICRRLRDKQYIYYEPHQGKRSLITIEINKHIRPDGTRIDLSSRFKKFPKSFRSGQARQKGKKFRSDSEVGEKVPKSKEGLSDCESKTKGRGKKEKFRSSNTICNNKSFKEDLEKAIKTF